MFTHTIIYKDRNTIIISELIIKNNIKSIKQQLKLFIRKIRFHSRMKYYIITRFEQDLNNYFCEIPRFKLFHVQQK